MKHKIKSILLILLTTLLLAGCAEERILEELGIITAYGLDINENGDGLLGSIATYQFSQQRTNENQLIFSTGRTAREVYSNADSKTAKQLVNGQLRAGLFGQELARRGIMPYVDGLMRNPLISDSVYITVTDLPAYDVINATDFEEAPNIGTYIYRLLEHAIVNENVVQSTMHEFVKNFMKVGADPVVPLLTKENDKIIIRGIGLFQDDRLVETVDIFDTFFYRLILDEYERAESRFTFPADDYETDLNNYGQGENNDQLSVSVHQIRSNTDIKLADASDFSFDVDITFEGRITEITLNLDLSDPEILKKLEEDIKEQLEDKVNEILAKTKELNVDPFGIGALYNTHFKKDEQLSATEMRENYPDFQFNVNADVKIMRYGITE